MNGVTRLYELTAVNLLYVGVIADAWSPETLGDGRVITPATYEIYLFFSLQSPALLRASLQR